MVSRSQGCRVYGQSVGGRRQFSGYRFTVRLVVETNKGETRRSIDTEVIRDDSLCSKELM